MKYLYISLGVIGVAAAAYGVFQSERVALPKESVRELPAPVVVVEMTDAAYSTTTLTIFEGEVVAFHNAGSAPRWPASDLHPTHEIYSDFDPRQPVEPGATWAFQFTRCGMWRMHDHLRPNIRGVIEVRCGN